MQKDAFEIVVALETAVASAIRKFEEARQADSPRALTKASNSVTKALKIVLRQI
jgi:hypothetical protein